MWVYIFTPTINLFQLHFKSVLIAQTARYLNNIALRVIVIWLGVSHVHAVVLRYLIFSAVDFPLSFSSCWLFLEEILHDPKDQSVSNSVSLVWLYIACMSYLFKNRWNININLILYLHLSKRHRQTRYSTEIAIHLNCCYLLMCYLYIFLSTSDIMRESLDKCNTPVSNEC